MLNINGHAIKTPILWSHEPASILHELVFHENYEAMQFLIDRGIDMTIVDYHWGGTAEGWAYHTANNEKWRSGWQRRNDSERTGRDEGIRDARAAAARSRLPLGAQQETRPEMRRIDDDYGLSFSTRVVQHAGGDFRWPAGPRGVSAQPR